MDITELLTTPDGAVLATIGGEVAKERPILFSGPMVKAILDGRKSQTRRVCKSYLQTVYSDHPDWRLQPNAAKTHCPYGTIGDRLWCRETFAIAEPGVMARNDPGGSIYAADYPPLTGTGFGPWKPSIFMPRAVSRITLEITDVRVERVQSISEEDAIAEGVSATRMEWWQGFMRHNTGGRGMVEVGGHAPPDWMEAPEMQVETISAVKHYQALWDSINAKRGHEWASNPWAWIVSFRRVTP